MVARGQTTAAVPQELVHLHLETGSLLSWFKLEICLSPHCLELRSLEHATTIRVYEDSMA